MTAQGNAAFEPGLRFYAPTVVLADLHSAVRSFLTSHRRSA